MLHQIMQQAAQQSVYGELGGYGVPQYGQFPQQYAGGGYQQQPFGQPTFAPFGAQAPQYGSPTGQYGQYGGGYGQQYGYAGPPRQQLTKWENLVHRPGVSLREFNTEFNVLVQRLSAYGAPLDPHMQASKYTTVVRVPENLRLILRTMMNQGAAALQSMVVNFEASKANDKAHQAAHSSSHRGPSAHVADVDDDDDEPRARKERRKGRDRDREFPVRSAKGRGKDGPLGRPNGNGKFCVWCGFYNHTQADCRFKRDDKPRTWTGKPPANLDKIDSKKEKKKGAKPDTKAPAKKTAAAATGYAGSSDESDSDQSDSDSDVDAHCVVVD
ncbi:MAG: hypothetical protein P4L83_01325 [Nevskia sp.]|nr:hypothetical protein [Nevskia sp.]